MISTLIGTGIGVVCGGGITWWAARFYYKKAADDLREAGNNLRDEAKEVRRLTNMVLRGLESADLVKINRDESNNPIGVAFPFPADAGHFECSGSEASLKIGSDLQNQDNAAQGQ